MMDQIQGINQSPPGCSQQVHRPWVCIVHSWCHQGDLSDQLPLLRCHQQPLSPEMGATTPWQCQHRAKVPQL